MNDKTRFVLRLEYDGSHFLGWQFQDPARAGSTAKIPLQNALENALQTALRHPHRIPVQGCGRTDTGVHAEEYYAHFDFEAERIEIQGGLEKLRHHLNGIFMAQAAVTHLGLAPSGFHALHSIKDKTYEYRVLLRRSPSPLLAGKVLWLPVKSEDFNEKLLEQALQLCQGEHDFAAFASAGSQTQSTVRHIFECTLVKETPFNNVLSGRLFKMGFRGSGFLKQMVRNLSGSLLEVAMGKRSIESLEKLLNPKQNNLTRQDAGFCAEANGLYLKKVTYSEEIF